MLSDAERAAGRYFKTDCAALLATLMDLDPPTHRTLPLLGVFRHACLRRRSTSTPIALKEIYRFSPGYAVHPDATVTAVDRHGERAPVGATLVPAGRFGFLYKEGRCPRCRASVRSDGRLVDGWQRPPLRGRSARD